MSEYAAKFKVSGLLVSGIEMPDKEEVDRNFIFRRLPSEPESCLAILRVKTEWNEECFDSKAYQDAKKRLLNFVSIHSVFRGLSATVEPVGVEKIGENTPLDNASLKFLVIKAKGYCAEEDKPKVLQREHSALENSIEVFRKNESMLRNNPYLVNAAHYLMYSDFTERDEEKLIDLVISLEALYLTERSELGYRSSLRVASLIGHLYDDRTPEQIAEEIRNLYEKRSKIVHGDPERVTQNEILCLRSYMRKSIQMFVRLSSIKTKRDILKLLDNSLFDNKIKDFFRT